MAQLKDNSTIDGITIAKKDLSNIAASLPSTTITALKGDTGNTGAAGSAGSAGTSGSNVTYALSGGNLYITTS